MKYFVLIIGIAAISCCSSQKHIESTNTPNQDQSTVRGSADSIPACIRKLIDSFAIEEKQNPPRKIFSYRYKGAIVYYVTPPCCDFFSDLYDSSCKIIGHPDGGFTGRGDGKLPDFTKERKDEKLIWEDLRK